MSKIKTVKASEIHAKDYASDPAYARPMTISKKSTPSSAR